MASIYQIPLLQDEPDQIVDIELDGNPYRLRVFWNDRFGYWALSVYTVSDVIILSAVKMVQDYPLIGRFADTRLPGGDLIFLREKGSALRPSYDDIGVTHNLYYYRPDAPAPALPAVVQPIAQDVIGTVWDSSLSTWDGGETDWDM
jgi:hypothetical protein